MSLKQSEQNQILALAAVFQAASLVETLAKTSKINEVAARTSVQSIFVMQPARFSDIYGDPGSLKPGLRALTNVLNRKHDAIRADAIRYALTLIQLERRLRKDKKRLNYLGTRLQSAQQQLKHFDYLHENVIANLASIYLDTISTLPTRVQVIGKTEFLQSKIYADRIRALLLAGMRAAVLWRQIGGRRWHFLLKRKQMAKTATLLLND